MKPAVGALVLGGVAMALAELASVPKPRLTSEILRHPGLVVESANLHEPLQREVFRCLKKNR